MDNIKQLTELINSEIKKQYRSDRQFAQAMGMPPTTLSSILKNGVKGTAYNTVMDICMALGIKMIYVDEPEYLEKNAFAVLNDYSKLDEIGKRVIRGAVKKELERMEADKERKVYLDAFDRAEAEEPDTIEGKIAEGSKKIAYKHIEK